jgi:hypothetical protein
MYMSATYHETAEGAQLIKGFAGVRDLEADFVKIKGRYVPATAAATVEARVTNGGCSGAMLRRT